ncbi:hypothetical protein [Fischerella sp. NIES-3754]|nr:hypothetical protein [Fischerella sp. NIES-3754]
MEPAICLKRSRAATIINYGRRVAEGLGIPINSSMMPTSAQPVRA